VSRDFDFLFVVCGGGSSHHTSFENVFRLLRVDDGKVQACRGGGEKILDEKRRVVAMK